MAAVVALLAFAGALAETPVKPGSQFDLIKLPNDPLGKYSLMSSVSLGADVSRRLVDSKRQPITQTSGVLKIPRGFGLYLQTNYAVVENPSLLKAYAPGTLMGIEFGPMPVGNDALKNLDHLRSLELIDLRNSDVDDAGLASLAVLKDLRLLNCSCSNIDGSGLKSLAGLKNLIWLNLSKNTIRDASVLTLFPQMKILELRRCNLNNLSLAHLAKLQELEYLTLSENHISAKGVSQLQGLKKLEKLRIAMTGVKPDDVSVFKPFKALRLLEVGGNGFDDKIAAAWKKELPNVAVVVAKGQTAFEPEVFRPLH